MATMTKGLTIAQLTELAKVFLRSNYGIALDIPIERNNRLRSKMGCFFFGNNEEPLRIELAGFLLKYGTPEVVVDTLYHECVHYALCHRGDPFDDGDEIFESELRRLGVTSSKTNRVGVYVEYDCAACGETVLTGRKRVLRNPQGYVTGCCDAVLINVHERIFNGTEAIE